MNWFHFLEGAHHWVVFITTALCFLLVWPDSYCRAFDIVLWGHVKYVRDCPMCGIVVIGYGHRLWRRRR
jgi:hypothetical protein